MPNKFSTNGTTTEQPQIVRRFERSELVQEIVSNKPGALIRYGTFIFFMLLLVLCAACWFIQFPDIVPAKATLNSINAPKAVVAKTSGKLIRLFAKEGELTSSGKVLGYLESTANHVDVINLSEMMNVLQASATNNDFGQLSQFINTPSQNLGELQIQYQAFQQSLIKFRDYIANGFYIKKKIMLAKDLSYLQKMHTNIVLQKSLSEQDLNLSQKTFDANQSLSNDKVISDFDYRNEKSKLINKKLTLPQINSALINNEAQQNEKLKEIAEVENEISQQKSIFIQSLNTFISYVEEWKNTYLLTAPIDGEISFAIFMQENQQLQAGQVVCFVNPKSAAYYAAIYIPQANFGKVKLGQNVLLKFPSYPFQEYGTIKGKIDFISNISTDSGYLAKVVLPNGLITNYKKQIQFRDGLTAQGEIITQNMRLLQRFYYNIVKQVKN